MILLDWEQTHGIWVNNIKTGNKINRRSRVSLHNANRKGGKHDTHITVLKPPMRHLYKNKITPPPIDAQLWSTPSTREISLLANVIHIQGHKTLYMSY